MPSNTDRQTLANAVVQAVQNTIKEHLIPLMSQERFDPQLFRNEKLWCEKCDKVLTHYDKIWREVYGVFSGKFGAPGDKITYMSCIEFVELVDTLQVVVEKQAETSPQK